MVVVLDNNFSASLSAPRIPGGTPPSRPLSSVIFGHTADCALERGATPSLHTACFIPQANWLPPPFTGRGRYCKNTSYHILQCITITGRFPLLGPPTSLIPALLRINCLTQPLWMVPTRSTIIPLDGFRSRAVGVPFTS